MGKYIIANTVEGKIKLEQMGFDLIMEQKVGQEMHYVFKNVDKECISVLYKRKDGNYGIIDTK